MSSFLRLDVTIVHFKNLVIYRLRHYERITENFHQFQVVLITRGQCQIMSQLDALSNLLHEYLAQSGSVGQANEKDKMPKVNFLPIVLPLAIGAVGLIWLKGLAPKG